MLSIWQTLLKTLLLSVALSAVLSACGQKGPLYLPKEPAAATTVDHPLPLKP